MLLRHAYNECWFSFWCKHKHTIRIMVWVRWMKGKQEQKREQRIHCYNWPWVDLANIVLISEWCGHSFVQFSTAVFTLLNTFAFNNQLTSKQHNPLKFYAETTNLCDDAKNIWHFFQIYAVCFWRRKRENHSGLMSRSNIQISKELWNSSGWRILNGKHATCDQFNRQLYNGFEFQRKWNGEKYRK